MKKKEVIEPTLEEKQMEEIASIGLIGRDGELRFLVIKPKRTSKCAECQLPINSGTYAIERHSYRRYRAHIHCYQMNVTENWEKFVKASNAYMATPEYVVMKERLDKLALVKNI
jgi:hypothetical protein